MDNSKNNSLSYNLNHPNEAGTNLLQLESQYHRTLINNNLSVNESQDNLLKRKRVSSNREEDGTSMPISQDNKGKYKFEVKLRFISFFYKL